MRARVESKVKERLYLHTISIMGSCLVIAASGCSREVKENPRITPQTSIASPQAEPQQDAQALLMKTMQSLQAGDVEEAGKAIRTAVALETDNSQVRFTLAIVLGQEHRYPEAVMMLDELAISVPETRLPALGQTAEWLVLQGEWQQAESRYKDVLAEVPEAAMAHRQLAQLLVRQGRRLEASKHLNALCQQGNIEEFELRALLSLASPFAGDIVGTNLEPIGPLGKARFAIGRGDWDNAATTLRSQKTLAPVEAALLGRIHAEQRDFANLESCVRTASELTSETADESFAWGVFAAHQGEHPLAVKHFCKAVLFDRTDERAYEALAASLVHLAAEREAAKVTERAQWLARTREIGEEMAANDQRDLNQLAELAQLLDQLHRPFESLSWQAVRVAYDRSILPENEQRSELNEINRKRIQLIESSGPAVTKEFILCGIDPESVRLSNER